MFPKAWSAACAAALFASSAHAGGLAFSKDGNSVFVPTADDGGERTAFRVNMKKNSFSKFDPAEYGAPPTTWYRATSKSGYLIGASESDIIVTDLEKKKTVKLASLPKGMWVADIAYDVENEWVLVSAYKAADDKGKGKVATTLYLIYNDGGKVVTVKTYNVSGIDALAYGPNNRLYFSAEGDLWEGLVGPEDPHDESRSRTMQLTAERVAPLAVRESRSELQGTRPQSIRQIAIAGERVLVQMGPPGGFGFAGAALNDEKVWSVASFRVPTAKTDTSAEDADDLLRHARRAQSWLESIRVRTKTSGLGFTASSPKGDRVALVDARGLDVIETKTISVRVVNSDTGDEETYEAERETE